MMRGLFSSFGRRSTNQLRKSPRRGRQRSGRGATSPISRTRLSLEHLESRVVLSADPVMTMAPDYISQTDQQTILFELARFSDVLDGPTANQYTYSIDWGDGSAIDTGFAETAVITVNVGDPVTGRVTGIHTYDEVGEYNVDLWLTEVGGNTVYGAMSISVYERDPDLFIITSSVSDEGQLVELTLDSTNAISEGFIDSWTISWGDLTETIDGNPTSVSHFYADGNNIFSSLNGFPSTTYFITAVANSTAGSYATMASQWVRDVAPTVSISGATDSNEGDVYTLDISTFDPAAFPVSDDAVVVWGIVWEGTIDDPFGGFEQFSGPVTSKTHVYADGDAVYDVFAFVVDNEGASGLSNPMSVTVHNVDPTANAGGAYSVDEGGGTVMLNGVGIDSAGDLATLLYEWDLDDNGSFETVGANPIFDATNLDGNGSSTYTVHLWVTDDDGGVSLADSATITVLNVDPTVAADNASVTADEGQTVVNSGTFADVPDDTVTLAASIGVVTGLGGVWSWTYNAADGPAPSETVVITATDEDGGSSFVEFDLVVNNLDPAITVDSATVTADEGDLAVVDGTVSDVPADVVLLTASIGTVINNGDGTWSWSYNTINGPFESQLVTISADDGDGGFDDVSFDLVVNNVDPTADAGGPYVVNEGGTVVLNGTGSDVPADLLSFAWDFDGDTVIDFVGANPTFDATSIDGDGSSIFTVTLYVSDGDGGVGTDTVTVTVANVAPTADAGGPHLTFDDTLITLSGSGSDPFDPVTLAWDLDGDNIFGETGAGATRGDETGANPTFNPTGLSTGSHSVTLRVSDDDGGVTTDTTTVNVLAQGVLLIDGTLYVVGGNAQGDNVLITSSGSNISVAASFNGSTPALFNSADVNDVQIRARGGNDVVVVGPNVTTTMTIDGGGGNDLLVGGSGRSVIIGGSGNDFVYGGGGDDVLLGGTGNDQIFGGGGNDSIVGGDGDDIVTGGVGSDLLIGSQDNDLLNGGNGEDVLVGGVTSHDNNVAALDAIMAIWTSAASFNSRVTSLTASGGLLQAGTAVFDDDDLDILIGGAGRDLVFGDTNPFDGAIDLIALQAAQDRLIAVN